APAGRTTLRPVLGPVMMAPPERVYVVMVLPQVQPRCLGRRPAAVIPSGFSRVLAARAWGVARSGQRGQSEARPRRRGRGPDLRAITRCPCPGLLTPRAERLPGWPGTWLARRASHRTRR